MISGNAPKGWKLKINKSFMTLHLAGVAGRLGTEIGNAILFPDALLSYQYDSKGGHFDWNVNPSTRPAGGRPRRPRPGRAEAGGHPAGEPGWVFPAENVEGV